MTYTSSLPTPTVTVHDVRVALEVRVDWHDGRGPVLMLSTPTHSGAQVLEVRERGRRGAESTAAAYVAEFKARHC